MRHLSSILLPPSSSTFKDQILSVQGQLNSKVSSECCLNPPVPCAHLWEHICRLWGLKRAHLWEVLILTTTDLPVKQSPRKMDRIIIMTTSKTVFKLKYIQRESRKYKMIKIYQKDIQQVCPSRIKYQGQVRSCASWPSQYPTNKMSKEHRPVEAPNENGNYDLDHRAV